MKTKFIILFLLIGFIAIVTKAQVCDIKGDWTGKLSVYGNEIPLVFHFDGEKCTIDSPDQGAKGHSCPVGTHGNGHQSRRSVYQCQL